MEWISVKDKLPPNDYLVLCFKEHIGCNSLSFYMGKGRVMKKGFWRVGDDGYAVKEPKVTHWMPLPQPPDGKK